MILSRRDNWTLHMQRQKRMLRQEEDEIDEERMRGVTKKIECNSKYKNVWDMFYIT